ncbi:MAG TPA: hypothetical protein PKD12_03945 [Nitrospira sp.]|nr:hypothetical protein [Nitrospira sp.]
MDASQLSISTDHVFRAYNRKDAYRPNFSGWMSGEAEMTIGPNESAGLCLTDPDIPHTWLERPEGETVK